MKIRNIVALGVIVGALLFWYAHAWALPTGASFTYIETWDEYGTQSSVPSIAPYVTIDPSTSSIVCGATVPWNHPGQNLTGCYLKIVPSGHGGENPGPTVAPRAGLLGNPCQTCITYTWIRIETAPASTAAIFLWTDSSQPQGVRGIDHFYLAISNQGQLRLQNSGSTPNGSLAKSHNSLISFGTAITNWFLIEAIPTIGINSSTAWQRGSITLNVYQSNGLRIASIGCTNCATRGPSVSSFVIDQIAFDAEFDNSIVEDFGPTWTINPGTNGTAAFVGPQYSWFTQPSGNSTPLQYAVTGVAHNWQAVSNVPPDPAKFVSTATQGNQDEYTANFPFSTGTLTQQALVSFQESDAAGVRLGTDLIVKPSGTTLAGNMCALTNGAYTFCESFYNNAVPDSQMPTKIGLQLGW